jgi:thioredoxin-dependent peroxiredoxin
MRILTTTSLLLLALCSSASAADPATPPPPQVGEAAPAIRLQDQSGTWQTLEQYRGQWVVLYFYPKDFTSGCTTQVCAFRDDIGKLKEQGAQVLGVSVDDVKSHAEFAEKYHVPFPLLSDATKETAQRYGVLTSKLGFKFARRDTFLIDPAGKIAKHYENVDPEKNVGQVIADLGALKAAGR